MLEVGAESAPAKSIELEVGCTGAVYFRMSAWGLVYYAARECDLGGLLLRKLAVGHPPRVIADGQTIGNLHASDGSVLNVLGVEDV